MADPVTRQHGGTGDDFPEMPLVGPPGPGSVSSQAETAPASSPASAPVTPSAQNAPSEREG